MAFNEFGKLTKVAVRGVRQAFVSQDKIDNEWQELRFHNCPNFVAATEEHITFVECLEKAGLEVIYLEGYENLTLDSIYVRDATIITPKGLILCEMGRKSRRAEARVNAEQYEKIGEKILGQITKPGTIEGGDLIWINDNTLAVGEGARTNAEGIRQLKALLPETEVHVVPLPLPDHPEDVFHLMSMISPLDKDLALVHKPLIPETFSSWLREKGISKLSLPEDEFIPMGCNVLALAPRKVLMLDRLLKTKALLEQYGCEVITYTGDHISRMGEGGPTCLTRPLARA